MWGWLPACPQLHMVCRPRPPCPPPHPALGRLVGCPVQDCDGAAWVLRARQAPQSRGGSCSLPRVVLATVCCRYASGLRFCLTPCRAVQAAHARCPPLWKGCMRHPCMHVCHLFMPCRCITCSRRAPASHGARSRSCSHSCGAWPVLGQRGEPRQRHQRPGPRALHDDQGPGAQPSRAVLAVGKQAESCPKTALM